MPSNQMESWERLGLQPEVCKEHKEILQQSLGYLVARSLTSKEELPRIEDSSLITLYWSLLVEGRAGSEREREVQAASAYIG